MQGRDGVDCDFCGPDVFTGAEVQIENDFCKFVAGRLGPEHETPPGSGLVVPFIHRETPFDLTPDEWAATGMLVAEARNVLDERWQPDGYNLIWNVGTVGGQEVAHVHLHVVGRFHDEPYAGRGARWWLKQPENRRPDPFAPGRAGSTPRRGPTG